MRAIKILLKGIESFFKMKFQFKFIIELSMGKREHFIESDYMLRVTNQLTSSLIAGADYFIPIDPLYEKEIKSLDYKKLIDPTLQILKKESLFGAVDDPVRGSYYIENKTHELCERTWAEFRKLEV